MENQVLGYQSPLYGRRTGQMKIQPFTFAECKWTNEAVGEAELKDLLHQSTLFQYNKNILILFSRSGFTKGCKESADTLGNIMLINYEDMKWNEID